MLSIIIRLILTAVLLILMCLGYKWALYVNIILISISIELISYLLGGKNEKTEIR